MNKIDGFCRPPFCIIPFPGFENVEDSELIGMLVPPSPMMLEGFPPKFKEGLQANSALFAEVDVMPPMGFLFATFCRELLSLAGRRKFERLTEAEKKYYEAFKEFCRLETVFEMTVLNKTMISLKIGDWITPLEALCKQQTARVVPLIETLGKPFQASLGSKMPLALCEKILDSRFEYFLASLSPTGYFNQLKGEQVLKQFAFLDLATDVCERVLEYEKEGLERLLKNFAQQFFLFTKACGYVPPQPASYHSFVEEHMSATFHAYQNGFTLLSATIRIDEQPIQLLVNRQRLNTVIQSADTQLTYRYLETYQHMLKMVPEKLENLQKQHEWIYQMHTARHHMLGLLFLPMLLVKKSLAIETAAGYNLLLKEIYDLHPQSLHEDIQKSGVGPVFDALAQRITQLEELSYVVMGLTGGIASISRSLQHAHYLYAHGKESAQAKRGVHKLEEELLKSHHTRRAAQEKNKGKSEKKSEQRHLPDTTLFSTSLTSSTSAFEVEEDESSSDSSEEGSIPIFSLSVSKQSLSLSLGRVELKRAKAAFNNPFACTCFNHSLSAQQDLVAELERLQHVQGKNALIECLSSALVVFSLWSEQTLAACLLEEIKPKTRQEALGALSHSQTALAIHLSQCSPNLPSLAWVQEIEQLDRSFRFPSSGNRGMQLLWEFEQGRQGKLSQEDLCTCIQRSLELMAEIYPRLFLLVSRKTQAKFPERDRIVECFQELLKTALQAASGAANQNLAIDPLEEVRKGILNAHECIKALSSPTSKAWKQLFEEKRPFALQLQLTVERHLHFIHLLLRQTSTTLHPALFFKKVVRSLFPALVQLAAFQALCKQKRSVEQVQEDVRLHSLWNSLQHLGITENQLTPSVKALIDESETAFNLNRYFILYQQLGQTQERETAPATLEPSMKVAEQSKKQKKVDNQSQVEEGWLLSQSCSHRQEAKRQQELWHESRKTLEAALDLIKLLVT